MGIDCGFDVYPRLKPTEENKQSYQEFINEIIEKYKNTWVKEGSELRILQIPSPDKTRTAGWTKLLVLPGERDNYGWVNNSVIQFAVGEYPSMPARPEHCYYFLRFSSKVSKGDAEPFIREVYKIAQNHFGPWCIHFWHELCETNDARQFGHHGWEEVHAARHECEDIVRESPTPSKQAADEETGKIGFKILRIVGTEGK